MARYFPDKIAGSKHRHKGTGQMNRWLVKLGVVVGLFVAFSLVVPDEAFSRGFRGGGFRGSSFASRGSVQRSSRPALFGGSRRSSATRKAGSTTDRAAYQKAKAAGTTYGTRAASQKAFMSKYGNQYGSKYKTKPAQRPSHIPQSTQVNGRTVPVTHSAQYGGYGYQMPGSGWVMYSVTRDVAMMSLLMNRHGYHYGAAPGAYYSPGPSFLGTLVMLALGGFAVSYLFRSRSGMSHY